MLVVTVFHVSTVVAIASGVGTAVALIFRSAQNVKASNVDSDCHRFQCIHSVVVTIFRVDTE